MIYPVAGDRGANMLPCDSKMCILLPFIVGAVAGVLLFIVVPP